MSPLKGKTKGRGREGRQHVHLIAEEDRDKPGTSGFPTMLIAIDSIDPRHAVNLGVHFYQSQNQAY